MRSPWISWSRLIAPRPSTGAPGGISEKGRYGKLRQQTSHACACVRSRDGGEESLRSSAVVCTNTTGISFA